MKRIKLQRELLPTKEAVLVSPGQYLATITHAVFRSNSKDTGTLLHIIYKIDEGKYKDRTVQDWLNVEHQSSAAEHFGQLRLRRLMNACEIAETETGAEFLNRRVSIQVGIRPQTEQYRSKNTVLDVQSIG